MLKYEVLEFNRVRDIRNDKDLPQHKVADSLGITQSTLSRAEIGNTEISNDKIIQLAKFYDVSIDYLFGLCDIKNSYQKIESKNSITKPITTIRKKLNLKQTQACEKLMIAQNSLSRYENGLRNIPNDTLIQMAILFNTSVDYLLGLTNEETPHPRNGESYRKLLNRYV